MKSFYEQVAPKELIKQDLRILLSHDRLDTSEKIQELLFMQSVEGRSHNGSGVFNKRTYVNTTIDDIVRALDYDPKGVKKERQKLIDDIVYFARDAADGVDRNRLVNKKGEPFLGLKMFRDRKVNARDILRGLYLGGLRDNADIRKATEEKYRVKIGCGVCYMVNVDKMVEMDLDGESLAHEPHEDRISEYKKCGLIMDEEAQDAGEVDSEHRLFYIRHRVGPGQSDDAAIIVAGILYNVDVAIGVFLSDAIDTLEKYAPKAKDQDQELSFYIARGFKDLGISMDDVYELTYLASIPEAEEDKVPDSSLRYLLSVDSMANRTAFQNHLAYIEGEPIAEMMISFKRILSTEFYEYMKRKLVNARRLDSLSLPDLSLDQLSRPAGEIAHQNYIVVSAQTHLSEVVRQFREKKAEVIIIVDKNNHIMGTLSATDLIYLSRRE